MNREFKVGDRVVAVSDPGLDADCHGQVGTVVEPGSPWGGDGVYVRFDQEIRKGVPALVVAAKHLDHWVDADLSTLDRIEAFLHD